VNTFGAISVNKPIGQNAKPISLSRIPAKAHRLNIFWLLADGKLNAISKIAAFTVRRLQLNRGPLVAYRNEQRILGEKDTLLTQYRELLSVQYEIIAQLIKQVQEQHKLLEEQQRCLNILFRPPQ